MSWSNRLISFAAQHVSAVYQYGCMCLICPCGHDLPFKFCLEDCCPSEANVCLDMQSFVGCHTMFFFVYAPVVDGSDAHECKGCLTSASAGSYDHSYRII